ncbi:MAG: hypothetical protein R3B99_00500 [Polyangiales bacterium]
MTSARGGSYPNRCVEGSHQLCVPVGFDDEVEPDHGYWQHTNRACEP